MKENDDKYRNTRGGDGGGHSDGDGTANWNSVLKQNPFSVPDGYFEGLEAVTRFRVGEAGQINLTAENFPVPAGYFETLEQEISARITEENLRQHAATESFS